MIIFKQTLDSCSERARSRAPSHNGLALTWATFERTMSRFIEFRVYRNGDWLPIPCTVEHATHNNVCTNRWYYVLSVEPFYFAHDLLSVFFPLAQIDSSRQSIASQIHLLLCSVHVRRIGMDLDTLGTHRRIISWIQLIMWPIRSHKRLIFHFTSSSTTVILAIFGACVSPLSGSWTLQDCFYRVQCFPQCLYAFCFFF